MHGFLEVCDPQSSAVKYPYSSHVYVLRWMFDCSRIPGPQGVDWCVSYAKEGERGDSGHIAVFRQGRVWKLDAWQNGHLLSVEEIEA